MKNLTRQRAGVVRRVVGTPILRGEPDALVATFDSRGVSLRPPRVRDESAEVYVTWGEIYHNALVDRARIKA